MREEELLRCQIQEWYPKFKPYTIRTLFHPLPDSFVRYLLGQPLHPTHSCSDSDSEPVRFLLPRPASSVDLLPRVPASVSSLSLLDSDEDDDDGATDPETAVARSIDALGGAVLPKLNWSAPKDSAWISADGTLRCTSFTDVALLLRFSDTAAHDPSPPAPTTTPPCAPPPSASPSGSGTRDSARKWSSGASRAVSQRDPTAFYPALLDRRHDLLRLIQKFFDESVRSRFELEGDRAGFQSMGPVHTAARVYLGGARGGGVWGENCGQLLE